MSLLKRAIDYQTPTQLVLTEQYYDFDKLEKLAQIDLSVKGESYVKDTIWPTEVDKLKRIVKNTKKKDKTNTLTYVRSAYERGRYYTQKYGKYEHGYQSMYSKARRLVMKGKPNDNDMVNDHPTLLVQLCDDYKIPCSKLKMLVENREHYLREIMVAFDVNRDVAKVFFTTACFGGCLDGWAVENGIKDTSKAPAFMLEFLHEHENIRRSFTSIPEFLDYVQIAARIKGKTGRKMQTSAMAIMLQDVESKIIMCMYNFLKENGVDVSSIIHDGIITHENIKVNRELLDACEQRITETFGFHIKLENKNTAPTESDLKWFQDHMQFIPSHKRSDAEPVFIDQQNCSTILEKLEGMVFRTERGLMMYDKEEGVWLRTEEEHYRIVERDVKLNAGEDSKAPTFKKLFSDAYKLLKAKAPRLNDWLALDGQSGFLCFNNGVLDMYNYKMLPHDPKYYFTRKIYRDFDCDEFDRLKEELMDRVFRKPFKDSSDVTVELREENGEVKVNIRKSKCEYYMGLLSRGVAGVATLKDRSYMTNIGDTKCGKGLQVGLFKQSLGEYVEPFNADNLKLASGSNRRESERDWTFALKFAECRLACSSELPLDSQTQQTKYGTKQVLTKLDANKIKMLVSGGDRLNGRNLYENACEFINRALLIIMVNDIPEVAPADEATVGRGWYIQFERSSSESITQDTENHFVADPKIKDWCQKTEVCDAFIALMCDYYKKTVDDPSFNIKPSYIVNDTRMFMGAGQSVPEWVKNNYDIYDGDKSEWFNTKGGWDWERVGEWCIRVETIHEFYTRETKNIKSDAVFSKELKKGGFLEFKDRKVHGKTRSWAIGLRVPPRDPMPSRSYEPEPGF